MHPHAGALYVARAAELAESETHPTRLSFFTTRLRALEEGEGGACERAVPVAERVRVGHPQALGHRRQLAVPEPLNFTPMAVSSISSGSPHVRPMGRTCGEPDEIKKNTHPKNITALFRDTYVSNPHRPRRGRKTRVADTHAKCASGFAAPSSGDAGIVLAQPLWTALTRSCRAIARLPPAPTPTPETPDALCRPSSASDSMPCVVPGLVPGPVPGSAPSRAAPSLS